MKRILITLTILTAFCATLAFAQAGPKREEKKEKPDTTSVKKPAPAKQEAPAKKSEGEKKVEGEKKDKKAEGEKKDKKAEGEKKAEPAKKAEPEKKPAPERKAEPAKKVDPETTAQPAPKAEEAVKPEAVKPTPAQTPAPKASPAAPMTSPSVGRAVLTGAMAGREPTAAIDTLTAPDDSLYFFTELVGLQGQTVTHRWKLNDEVMAEVPISVGAPHWRAYSKKRMIPAWAGTWTVEAVDADGQVLARKSFVYRVR